MIGLLCVVGTPTGREKRWAGWEIIIVSKREERKSKSKEPSIENTCLSMKNGKSVC